VVSGWLAVREPRLYLTVEHFHTQLPTTGSDHYQPPLPEDYVLSFADNRYWVSDAFGIPASSIGTFSVWKAGYPLNDGQAGSDIPPTW